MEQHTGSAQHTVCDCGHAPTAQHTGSGATGRAVDAHGFTRCYACAEELERAAFRAAGEAREPFGAYLKADASGRLTVTTWTGATLATVTESREIPLTRMSFTHGRTIRTFTARDAHGRLWYGRGNAGIATTIRRKGK